MIALRPFWFAAAAAVLTHGAPVCGQQLELRIGVTTGTAFITNASDATIAFDAYEITSAGGGLIPAEWTSIAEAYDVSGDQSVDAVSEWFELSAVAANISEGGTVSGVSGLLGAGDRINLGPIWSTSGAADLTFEYLVGSQQFTVAPSYFLEADLNGDNVVIASDFTILRDSIGAMGTFADINGDGVVDITDTSLFQSQFGASNPLAAASSIAEPVVVAAFAVPEPASATLVVLGVSGLALAGRPGRRR